jgi:hypothetical protein
LMFSSLQSREEGDLASTEALSPNIYSSPMGQNR